MLNTLFVKVPSTFPSAPLLRDRTVTANTLYLYDFADSSCWPAQAAPVNGSSFANLTLSDTNAATAVLSGGSTFGFSGGGITFDAETNEFINLPASGFIPTNTEGFCYAVWYKQTGAFVGFQGILDASSIATASGYQYGVFAQSATVLRVYGPGADKHISVTPPASGTIVQIGASIYRKTPGGNFFTRAVVNGAPVGIELDSGVTTVAAAVAANPVLGKLTTTLANSETFAGNIYRVWCENYPAAGQTSTTMQAKLLTDYNANVGRFS